VADDAKAKVLAAVAERPLPMHVLFARTGLPDDDVRAAVMALQGEGAVTRHGDLVGKLALPSVVVSSPAEEEPVQGPDVPVGDEDFHPGYELRGDGGSPPPDPGESRFYVATKWAEIEAQDAESAADIVLSGNDPPATGEVLVMLASDAIWFERAVVTRRRA
jgi:hypothetical protein